MTSVLAVILLIAASGGLHLDGLADTADGFFSSRPRERILEIMRDNRTGPMEVAAIVCSVAFTSRTSPTSTRSESSRTFACGWSGARKGWASRTP